MSEKGYILLQAILSAIAAAAIMVFFGCSPKVQPPLLSGTDSTRVHVETKYDSIWVDRWHVVKEKGDTIWLHDSIYIEKWREKHTRDTICVRDSVPYEVRVVQEVRKRNGYDKFTARGFWLLLGILVLYIALRVYVRFKR